MKEVIEWFWKYGVQREGKYSVGISTWLDGVTQVANRAKYIDANLMNNRACLAVWGPSQTGKSTMISDSIDGEDGGDGKDSALTWCEEELARFTGDAFIYPKTIIFNPYNGGSDGSGLVTRYHLKSDDEVKDHRHPAQIKFATRAQILLALSIGYIEECLPYDGDSVHHVFDQMQFETKIKNAQASAIGQSNTPKREAVELLQDLAEVIEIEIRTQDRFRNLASNWAQLRTSLLSEKTLCASFEAALSLTAQLLWDDAKYLTTMFRQLMEKSQQLKNEWGDKPVYASLKVTKLLLDIDTYRKCLDLPDPPVNHLCATVTDDAVNLDTFSEPASPIISGNSNFGLLQALISELQVPLRRETLEKNNRLPFLHFLEKADYLDIPGVPNRETGSKADTDTKVSAENFSDEKLFTTVLKQGKTLSLIFLHARQLSIDSFIILKRFRDYAKNSGVLANGIQTWLQTLDKNWTPDKQAPLKYYLALTFFAEEAKKAYSGGVNTSTLNSYAEQIQQLSFAQPLNARFFVTTYPKLGTGENAFPKNDQEQLDQLHRAESVFQGSNALTDATKLSDEDFKHVFYDDDGGVGYLFDTIADEISTEKRFERCRKFQADDMKQLVQSIEPHLPPVEDNTAKKVEEVLNATIERLEKALDDEGTTPEKMVLVVNDIASVLKELMTFPPENLDPIPSEARQRPATEQQSFLARQLGKWYEYHIAKLPQSEYFERLPELLTILMDNLLNSEDAMENLSGFFREYLGSIRADQTDEASNKRKFLAMAITNCIFFGTWMRYSTIMDGMLKQSLFGNIESGGESKENMPAYHSLISPFLARLDEIRSNHTQPTTRGKQPGDEELVAIYQRLKSDLTQE